MTILSFMVNGLVYTENLGEFYLDFNLSNSIDIKTFPVSHN